MATGTPTPKRKSAHPVQISYNGKKPVAEIINGPAGSLENVLVVGDSPFNHLIWAENLSSLRLLAKDPDVIGKVKLIYIDPPYATQTSFQTRDLEHAYHDDLSGADYVEFLRERLVLLEKLIAPDGSIYVHIDNKMVAQTKLLLDEVFGEENFRSLITRRKCNPKNFTSKSFGNVSDYILFYTASSRYTWNKQFDPWDEERAREYQYIDERTGRRYMKVPVHAPGTRNGETGQPWRGKLPPPGKHWQYTPRLLDEMDARGEIYWSSNGNPRRKVFLDQSEGVSVQDIWLTFPDAHNQNSLITGYPTEKNAELLDRIIQASTLPGDLVLDCFSGSGTTVAVASKLGRAWIGIDQSPVAIRAALSRFAVGLSPMGDFVGARKKVSVSKAPHTQVVDFRLSVDTAFLSQAPALIDYWAELLAREPQPSDLLDSDEAEPSVLVSPAKQRLRGRKPEQSRLPGLG